MKLGDKYIVIEDDIDDPNELNKFLKGDIVIYDDIFNSEVPRVVRLNGIRGITYMKKLAKIPEGMENESAEVILFYLAL